MIGKAWHLNFFLYSKQFLHVWIIVTNAQIYNLCWRMDTAFYAFISLISLQKIAIDLKQYNYETIICSKPHEILNKSFGICSGSNHHPYQRQKRYSKSSDICGKSIKRIWWIHWNGQMMSNIFTLSIWDCQIIFLLNRIFKRMAKLHSILLYFKVVGP